MNSALVREYRNGLRRVMIRQVAALLTGSSPVCLTLPPADVLPYVSNRTCGVYMNLRNYPSELRTADWVHPKNSLQETTRLARSRVSSSDPAIGWDRESAKGFFADSAYLDYAALRPLSHVAPNWELTWDSSMGEYEAEEGSLAAHLNVLIEQVARSVPPTDYHSHENRLAQLYARVGGGRFHLSKSGKLWIDSQTNKPTSKEMVGHMIEQASSGSDDVPDLVLACAGRVATAMRFGVRHFDDLDDGHLAMLAVLIAVVLFRRSDWPVEWL